MSEDLTAEPGQPRLGPILPNQRFDEAHLIGYLREHLPGFSGECEIRQFQGGQSNPTYRLDDGRRFYVLRKQPAGRLLPSAHAVDREFRIMQALAKSPVPVPKMYLLCEDRAVIGQMFYVMEWVDGRVFADPALPRFPALERAQIYDAMNATLAQLHRVDFASLGLSNFGHPHQFVARQISRWTRQYQATELRDSPAMDELIAWLPCQDPGPEEAAINHGDYRLGNLLYHPTEPRVLAVVDWELSTIGHPIADLAYNCLVYHESGNAGRTVAPGGLGTPGIPAETEYVDAYCRRVGRSRVVNWSFFIAFELFRAASIMAGVYRRAQSGNAADAHALEVSNVYHELAEQGWRVARQASP
jgi:aminoglycoside phosphotransferase (APT) family kinase protein